MPFNNFENRHFSEAEGVALNAAIDAVEAALTDKLANLSPQERLQYRSVNEENKLIINKVREFREIERDLSPDDVDWEEFEGFPQP